MASKYRVSIIYKIVVPALIFVLLLTIFSYFMINLGKKANSKIILISIIFTLIYFIIYLVFLRKIIIKPIERLITAMWKVSRGKEVKIDENSSREFNLLFNSFNNMVFELNYLKVDYYEEKLKLQEAELNYLQSQIKPHFFLNLLNIIYNLATLKDYENIAKMTLYLGSYFQFIINNEKKLVTLNEEINHITNYLEIQCLRLLEQFNYQIIVEDELKSALIPPLTIQPFVENSIIHGMKNITQKIKKYNIRIIISLNIEGFLEIEIIDNGRGFPLEKLKYFQQRKFGNSNHIGIWNVYKRLKLNFGKEAELKFFNSEPGGAIVKIIIPHISDSGC